MRILIVGCGLVGRELAKQLRADGHYVVGTTTTPAKVSRLRDVCDDVVVLTGSDTEAVHRAADQAEAIVVTAGPAAAQAMTVEQRQRTYRRVLVDTAESVSSSPGEPYVVMLSSLSVYGDAANHLEEVDESSPLSESADPSPAMFQAAEHTYRAAAADRLAVFRCADITGGDDPPIMDKLRMAHQVLGGSVPFYDEALFYRVHMNDVVGAVRHAIAGRVVGTFNLTHAEVPPAMQPFFDAMCALDGLPPLVYRNELLAPTRPVSVAALLATGFQLAHTDVVVMPTEGAAAPPSALSVGDRVGRDLVTAALDRIVAALHLVEETSAAGDAALPLAAVGGPLAGRRIGEFRVFSGREGLRVVSGVLTIDDFGIDTHQVYGFTPRSSAVPHFFLDTAISPNTEGTYHFGLDLVPRVDLGASLDYSEYVYGPIAGARSAALEHPGVRPVPSLGPLQWSVRSPWMVAAILQPQDVAAMSGVVTEYLDQWLRLIAAGPASDGLGDVEWQDLPTRDLRNRQAMFSPRTNPVWGLLDRLVGPESVAAMRSILLTQR